MSRLLSVNVALPQDVAWHGKTVRTAIWKQSVGGKRRVRRLNIDGDRQGDLVGHGGEQRAVLVYQIESYRHWAKELGRSDFVYGQFGENLTVDGLADDEVCIGDRYRIGSAVFEVSQPRVTCYRVGIRLGEPRMAALLVAHHRPGFYMRVLQEGDIEAGDEIVKLSDGAERLSVADADALIYLPERDPAVLERALRIDAFSPGWKTAFRNLADRLHGNGWAENKGLILNAGVPTAWQGFRRLRVIDVRRENATVLSLEVAAETAETAETIVPPSPGQFITLRLPVTAEQPLLRSYSLTTTADPARYCISVKVEPRGAAGAYLRDRVRVGDRLDVAAPRGAFVLRDGTQPVVLLSAGIGVTPVLAMLQALSESKSTRVVWWCHGARSSAEHPFAESARALLHRLPNHHAVIAYSQPLPTDAIGVDFDIRGRLGVAALRRAGMPRDADFYLCGPDAFMRDSNDELVAWGVPPERIRAERFGPQQSFMPGVTERVIGPAHQPAGPEGSGPTVSFARSGISVNWDDRYASLLELAEACDVNVRWACRTGVCHTCISRLVDGTVAYRPQPLERIGAENVLICCAQPRGEVTLDL